MGDDGGAVLAGETCEKGLWPMNDFFAVKLDADGGVLWTWRVSVCFRVQSSFMYAIARIVSTILLVRLRDASSITLSLTHIVH